VSGLTKSYSVRAKNDESRHSPEFIKNHQTDIFTSCSSCFDDLFL